MSASQASLTFERALLALDRNGAREALIAAMADEGLLAAAGQICTPALERIGDDWANGGISLAQLYMAGRIAEEVVSALLPVTVGDADHPPAAAVVVLEDHHALGKRLVLASLRSSGRIVADWGHGARVADVVSRCRDDEPRLLLVSTLMLPSALAVRRLTQELSSLDRPPAVVVGGAPFRMDPELWHEVGADAMGADATDACGLVERFLGGAA